MPILGDITSDSVDKKNINSTNLLEALKDLAETPKTVADLSSQVSVLEDICKTFDFDGSSDTVKEGAVSFDVLGGSRSLFTKITATLLESHELISETEKLARKGKISLIDGCDRAKDISQNLDRLMKSMVTAMERISKPNEVTAVLQAIAPSLTATIDLASGRSKSQYFKDLDSLVVVNIIKILECTREKLAGPYDDQLLGSLDQFLCACFSHNDKNVQRNIVSLWSATFGDAQGLTYSSTLRKCIVAAQKKNVFKAPGLVSTKDKNIGSPVVQGTVKSTTIPTTAAPKKKRVMALIDDDSVDYVPIKETNSAKKMKLTEHQKENFTAVREKLPYMDEDSVLTSSAVLKNLPSQFEVDTSMSVSVSMAAKATAPTTTTTIVDLESPRSAKDANNVVELDDGHKDVDNNNSNDQKSAESLPKPSLAKKRSSAVKLNFEACDSKNTTLFAGTTSPAKVQSASKLKKLLSPAKPIPSLNTNEEDDSDVIEIRDDTSVESVSPPSSESSILVVSTVLEAKRDLAVNSLVSSRDTDSDSKDSTSVSTRSRRSQNKSTPVKYVKKTPIASPAVKSEKKTRGRPKKQTTSTPTQKSEKAELPKKRAIIVESDSDDDNSSLADIKADADRSSSDEATPAASLNVNTVSAQKNESEMNDVLMKTPPKSTQEKITEGGFSTPSVHRVAEASTPGILKRIGTPNTMDRKRLRVHFTSEESMDPVEEADKSTAADICLTPKRQPIQQHLSAEMAVITPEIKNVTTNPAAPVTTFATPAPSDLESPMEPVFPSLRSNQDPITKIISKLLPMANTGAPLLRKTLENKGVTTIGDLAMMCRKDVCSLNTKKPRLQTVISVLKEYADSIIETTGVSKKNMPNPPSAQMPAQSPEKDKSKPPSPQNLVRSPDKKKDKSSSPQKRVQSPDEQPIDDDEADRSLISMEDVFEDNSDVTAVVLNDTFDSLDESQDVVSAVNVTSTVCPEKTITPTKENHDNKSLIDELARITSFCSNIATTFPQGADNVQLKEILTATNAAIDAMCVLQRETVKRI